MTKKEQTTCRCPAYPFPHRMSGGKCEMPCCCPGMDYDPIGFEGCGDCEMDDRCLLQDSIQIQYQHHREQSETLSPQERNPDFKNW